MQSFPLHKISKLPLHKKLFYHQLQNLFFPYPNRIVEQKIALNSPFLWSNVSSFRTVSTRTSPFSVAIVGSGPAGFYTAKYLRSEVERLNSGKTFKKEELEKRQRDIIDLHIDIIEKLPTPFGLVRFGVAPDHQETKNVERDFSSIITDNRIAGMTNIAASSINYVGNVTVGVHVSLQELLQLYDAVVLAYGCNSDQKLLLDPNGDQNKLMGIHSAREFVAWYNGHPDFIHVGEKVAKLIAPSVNPQAHVVIIGNGNVALDCARILAKGANGLMHTDMASHALPILQDGVKHITIIGRRGHVQASFTIKELRELTKMKENGYNTSFTVFQDELDMGMTPTSVQELEEARPKLRIDKLLREYAVPIADYDNSRTSRTSQQTVNESTIAHKDITLRFLLNPVKFCPSVTDTSRVGSVICDRTALQGNAGAQHAVGTGELQELKADLVLVSIGYKGDPLPGLHGNSFNLKKGVVNHLSGKVVADSSSLVPKHGLYASGWIKRGPSGIIGSNIADARETVATIILDLENGYIADKSNEQRKQGRKGLLDLLKQRGVAVVDWNAYEKIDAIEKSRKRTEDQPKEKIVSIEEMIKIAYTK